MNLLKKILCLIVIILLCGATLAGCSNDISKPNESGTKEPMEQLQTKAMYEVDYLKISPMIEENVEKEVIDAAINVIKAFLNYENKASIVISGNKARFLNDMGYVIDCTCPMFSAFTDYDEMTSYDEGSKTVSWNYFVSQDEFQKIFADFTKTVEEYLAVIEKDDSDAMKAILLYYTMLHQASYDYEILGDAYETMDNAQYHLRDSSYNVFVNKTGICTNLSQALMFLYTQAELTSGTVLHQGGAGAHMWVVVEIDDRYYYCDPTWDVGTGPKTFGITADDRGSWAGGYTKEEGTMLSTVIASKYQIDDDRFAILREKIPVEITDIKVDKEQQSITFIGYDYEYIFHCIKSKK